MNACRCPAPPRIVSAMCPDHSRLALAQPQPEDGDPTTHDYTRRGWGHDYIFKPIDGGLRAEIFGWGHGLSDGDYLLLRNGDGSTRYQLDHVEYIGGQGGPADQWRAAATFAPRPA